MDWQLLGLSFITVFLSELGDKSQLAAIALSSSSKFPKAIFLGTAAALLLASFLGVLLGEGVAQLFPEPLVKFLAACGFAVMGVRLLWLNSQPSASDNSQN
ncbi:MAG: TMEM165/GDT1 family protein [Oscillatoriaceae bacterium SKW80]|nr:TMEM165/GDT1 family protein [Oscillatoriaceae bacterium SKYG93]MCX8119282.1 TMEM165/GDT1 family protein [Oscillatoriaceae bacterium SKW80]MDW8454749.1 TMEM165/GDT1 family protein [Oscillatoriaceae cyanobacterium SKYGB_i_bin93]HIK28470.1 TMEM165/GDT1 family protein [Oscillatoriaceae cyanobacterium M7585_C2015_266]